MGLDAGQIALDEDFDEIQAASNEKPVVQIYLSGNQSIPDNTLTALSFGSENFDTHGFHSTSVNPTRVTPNVPGVYRITATCYFSGRTDWSELRLVARRNGAGEQAPSGQIPNVNATGIVGVHTTVLLSFNGTTDYAEVCVLQNNAANVAVNALAGNPAITLMEMEYVRGPL